MRSALFSEAVLQIESVDKDVYRGLRLYKPPPARAVYGGHLVTQALRAAVSTVEPEYTVHSLHCYFIRPGKPDTPIYYHVDRLRDGRSFVTRAVRALQDDVIILYMTSSFHRPERLVVSHQYDIPSVPGPEGVKPYHQLITDYIERSDWPPDKAWRGRGAADHMSRLPIELRPLDPKTFLHFQGFRHAFTKAPDPLQTIWVKAKVSREGVEPGLSYLVATYLSDWQSLLAAVNPHPSLKVTMVASLDHSVWFHEAFDPGEWLLREVTSPKLKDGHFVISGRLWTSYGRLVASFAQEGLLRGELLNKL